MISSGPSTCVTAARWASVRSESSSSVEITCTSQQSTDDHPTFHRGTFHTSLIAARALKWYTCRIMRMQNHMLSRWSPAAPVVVILCTLSLARVAAAADLSEPKAAAKTFVTALAAHDLATLRSASIGNDEERQRIEAMSDLIVAQRKYGDAAHAKFGEDARVPRRDVAKDFEEKLKTAEVKMEGDSASLADPQDPQSPPLKLKRESGDWKIDLSSMQMRGAAAAGGQMKQIAEAMNTTADEIASGKYASFLEAQKALTQRLAPITDSLRRGSSTAPSSQPSR